MELNRDIAHYILRFYHGRMTDAERKAENHLLITLKVTRGRSDRAAQEEARRNSRHSAYLSDDPEVLRLTSDGYETFVARTAKRILQECGDKVLLNRCPRCAELAQTPTAEQCRFCGFDWRDEKLLNQEVASYIVHFHGRLMTDAECRAETHLFATLKLTGRTDIAAQKEARDSGHYSGDLCDDPVVLRLTSDGYEAFVARTAKRILQECGDKVLLNRCPRCRGLARTPTAKQCRFCGFDWHDEQSRRSSALRRLWRLCVRILGNKN